MATFMRHDKTYKKTTGTTVIYNVLSQIRSAIAITIGILWLCLAISRAVLPFFSLGFKSHALEFSPPFCECHSVQHNEAVFYYHYKCG